MSRGLFYNVFVLLSGVFFSLAALAGEEVEVEVSEDFVYVCKDAGAGTYEAFPDVCRLADGRLLCVFYAGYGHVALPHQRLLPRGGRICGCYSSDEGKTWSAPKTMIDTPLDDRDPSVTQLDDGRLLMTFFTYERIEKNVKTKTYLTESTDGGQTWTEPKFLFDSAPCSSPIRVLSDGTLVFPVYMFISGQKSSGAVSLSTDRGKTWSELIVIPNGGMNLDAETDVIELKNGDLWAVQRPAMAWSVSSDKGKTWSVSKSLRIPGHCPYLFRTKDDVILMGIREPRARKTAVCVSRDECKTWSKPYLVDDFSGAYPSLVQLKDGAILFVYYEEGSGSNIRAKRITVPAKTP